MQFGFSKTAHLVVFAVIFMVVGAVLVVAFLESATGPSRRVLGLVVGVLVGWSKRSVNEFLIR